MIQIFVDSGANLSPELREQYNIHLLPMALTIDDQPAPEGLDGHEYYEALRSGADVRTSMVNPDEAKKAFETYLSQGLIERPHQLRRRHFAAALRRFPHKGRSVSKRMVTGPSFRESTCISAPNSPC